MPLLLFYSLIYQIQEGETDRRSCGLRFKALIFARTSALLLYIQVRSPFVHYGVYIFLCSGFVLSPT
jgi:hypothetical protein